MNKAMRDQAKVDGRQNRIAETADTTTGPDYSPAFGPLTEAKESWVGSAMMLLGRLSTTNLVVACLTYIATQMIREAKELSTPGVLGVTAVALMLAAVGMCDAFKESEKDAESPQESSNQAPQSGDG